MHVLINYYVSVHHSIYKTTRTFQETFYVLTALTSEPIEDRFYEETWKTKEKWETLSLASLNSLELARDSQYAKFPVVNYLLDCWLNYACLDLLSAINMASVKDPATTSDN